MKEVKKYGENGVCTCKDKRERELESKGLKEKVLEFKEVFRKRAKSFCAKRIWQSDIILQNRFAIKLYHCYPIYSSNIYIFQLLHVQLFIKIQIYPFPLRFILC